MLNTLTQIALPSLFLIASASGAQQDAGDAEDGGFVPEVMDASGEGADAIARFEVQAGFRVELFAAEPLLANPVCFTIDERGRFFVGETFRHHAGVTDMREHMDWLNEDLASQTVADRVAMFARNEGDEFNDRYARAFEQVRLIVDTDGDGRADTATVFADGFDDPAAGIGAGLLARDGDVYYTCIPDLWLLRDEDGDGRADVRKVLHTGFGVRVALLGHDLHGLRMGPDGRLYFSIGDRGFHVETEGRTLAHPRTGAVLRCEPDGSGLEVFATGLRNPQELVFDDHGDLFTGDNNSDGGDEARWVWVLEGGDCGWRQAYQWITRPNLRGPWNAEQLWHPPFAGQAAYINPPIANIADGPSGLTVYPGTGWGDRWRGHFFLCDFRGDRALSGVHTFRNQPKGAGFELVGAERFLWKVLVTDVEFGPGGDLYVSDWVSGWNKTGKGRIYRISDPAFAEDERARETASLLARGFAEHAPGALAALLGHADQRVRQAAQFELVRRGEGSYAVLLEAARYAHVPLARLHGIWGLGQLARSGGIDLEPLVELLGSDDLEVRCQAARVLGDGRHPGALVALTDLLAGGRPRARLFAAMALGKLGRTESIGPVAQMLRAADDGDPWLRYAGIFALGSMADQAAVLALADDASAAVRRAVLVVLRRHERPEVARFLDDPDPSIVAEAARAIYDVPILSAMEALAVRLERPLPGNTERPLPGNTERPLPGNTERPLPGNTERPLPGNTERPLPGNTERP
ncbi:MAG: glucose dehydrogenase, partial [Planctomycetota bacterium]